MNFLSNSVHKFVTCVTTPDTSSFIHCVEFVYCKASVMYKINFTLQWNLVYLTAINWPDIQMKKCN